MSDSSSFGQILEETTTPGPGVPIYQAHYGLLEAPFELTPDPRFLFLSDRHREALSNLEYGLFSAKPITVLVGEAGTGKTTLLGAALASERCVRVRTVCLRNPALTRAEFIEGLARQFELSAAARTSKASLLAELETLLRERRKRQEVTALVIDEAQTLSDELLEEIRLLANIETATERFLPLVLVGQPELSGRLNQPGLRQLKQRVALRCEITPFGVWETASYITFRVRTAGGDASSMFTREAVQMIHDNAQGIPRTINVICENALITGLALNRPRIDTAIVRDVCRDFDLHEDRSRVPAPQSQPAEREDLAVRHDVPEGDPSPQRVAASGGASRGILGLVGSSSAGRLQRG